MKRTVTINYNLENDYNDLIQLGKDYQSDINYFYSRFSGIKNINNLNFRKIRDNEVKTLNHLKLKSQYLQRCLNSALGNIKSMWSNILNQVRVNITGNDNLTEQEKHFLYIVMKSNTFVAYIINTTKPFDSLLDNKYFKKWKESYEDINLNEKKLRTYLRRQIRKSKSKISYTRKDNQIKINTILYRFSNNKLKVTNSYKKGNRLQLVSKNKNVYKSEGTLIFNGNNIKVHFPIDVRQRSLNGKSIIGIDKGYNKLITGSSNHVYGDNYSDVIKPFIDKYLNTQKERNRYWALYHKYKEINPKKADNIKKYNLGYKKFNSNKHLLKETKKKFINKAINDLIKIERPKEIVLEDLTWSKKQSNKITYALSSWDKGYLHDRILFKAYENNIVITEVNPAYTSQICSNCGKLGKRKKETFKCDNCNTILDADYNASINIKNRKGSEITKYMKPSMVLKQLKLV